MSESPFEPGPACLHRGDVRPDAFEQGRRDGLAGPGRAARLSALRHELSLPMNIFAGMGWLLQHSGLNPTQQHYLHELQVAGAQLLRIVERLLDDAELASDGGPEAPPPPPPVGPAGAAAPAASATGREPAARPGNGLGWRMLHARLCGLLDDADTACLELAREHEGRLRLRLGPAYEAWARALRDFDFELALRLLQAERPGSAAA